MTVKTEELPMVIVKKASCPKCGTRHVNRETHWGNMRGYVCKNGHKFKVLVTY